MLSFLKAILQPEKNLRNQIRNIFGYYPGNISLYKLAFRHKSVASKNGNGIRLSNERLEFLGDAILDAIIADFLFKRFPYKDEGFLTQMRSKIVSRNHLNKLSVKLGLSKLLSSTQDQVIYNKSMHGDAFEAFVGALYLDKGYRITEKIVVDNILRLHIDLEDLLAIDTNFKSKLIEWAQQQKKIVEFNVIEEIGSGYHKQYVVDALLDGESLGRGRDFSIKGAEQIAAGKVCEGLGIMANGI